MAPFRNKLSVSDTQHPAVAYLFPVRRSMRVMIARAISIAGHPVAFILVAVLVSASTGGASLRQLWSIAGALATLGVVVLEFSYLQVRPGGGHTLTRVVGVTAIR